MTIFEAFILGAVQAITEFLPISSSGHLILVASVLQGQASPLFFDVVLHWGTAAALFLVFYKDLLSIVKALYWDATLKKRDFANYSSESRLGFYIVLACIPAVLVGLVFGDVIEHTFRTVNYVILFSLLGTLLMIVAEVFSNKTIQTKEVDTKSSLTVGCLQVLALLPGVSRSGSTISAGMLSGLSREQAARFSFLLSIPLIVAAGIFELGSSASTINQVEPLSLVVGFFTSFVIGVVVIRFLLKFLKSHTLWAFIIYRIILVLVLFVTLF